MPYYYRSISNSTSRLSNCNSCLTICYPRVRGCNSYLTFCYSHVRGCNSCLTFCTSRVSGCTNYLNGKYNDAENQLNVKITRFLIEKEQFGDAGICTIGIGTKNKINTGMGFFACKISSVPDGLAA